MRIYDRLLSPEEVRKIARSTRSLWLAKKPAAERSDAEKAELFDWWLQEFDEAYKSLGRQDERSGEGASVDQIARHVGPRHARTQASRRRRYVLFRGEYDKRRDEVTPGHARHSCRRCRPICRTTVWASPSGCCAASIRSPRA